ncbi:MAG: Gfo/Idh/MocA family oxidoreductase [Atopobiaceae bacterium]|nr:Gfo/Idh/MocA family oxidoreductase [Atopobiaceae bacterium]
MIRWAILGAGTIARRFVASLAHEPRSVLVGISRSSQERAEQFKAELKLDDTVRAYESHDELIADDTVDAIYLALPHALHFEWAQRALLAGKAVLCEKPACLNAQDMAALGELAQQQHVLFMEAMKCRFVPIYREICTAAQNLGEIERVETSLCNNMASAIEAAQSYHVQAGPGAGVLLDSGVYCASWIEDYLPGIPELVSLDYELRKGVDYYIDAELTHGGFEAHLECAFDRAKPRQARIVGSRGFIVVEDLHRPQKATVYRDDAEPQLLEQPYEYDDFYGEISHFCDLMLAGHTESDIMPLKDSVHCALILDCIRAGIPADE